MDKGSSDLRDLWDVAWHRFNVISSIVGDANSRIIATLFYFTILVPFGIGSRLMTDPMRQNTITDDAGKTRHAGLEWMKREPVPTDIDSAKQQG